MTLTCPICNFSDSRPNFKVLESDCRFATIDGVSQHLVRHQCPSCDVIFGSQEMLNLSAEKLTRFYERVYSSGYAEGDSTEFQLATFNTFNPTMDGVYVNWGAGNSRVSDVIRAKGYNLLDYDPFVQNVFHGRFTSIEKVMNTKFNGIMSNSVIEHLQDPIKELITMKSLLKPGAFMIHSTDCYQYRVEWTKGHLFFFVGKSLGVLSEKAGLKHEFIGGDDLRVKFTPL